MYDSWQDVHSTKQCTDQKVVMVCGWQGNLAESNDSLLCYLHSYCLEVSVHLQLQCSYCLLFYGQRVFIFKNFLCVPMRNAHLLLQITLLCIVFF